MIAAARRQQPGFTLVEVMISVALVLILIIGINQAFKMVTDTVGAGQTLSAIVRDNRAIQPVLYDAESPGVHYRRQPRQRVPQSHGRAE
jgi:prepilin-type N-terminal cleavage/methylation domain-containing protein